MADPKKHPQRPEPQDDRRDDVPAAPDAAADAEFDNAADFGADLRAEFDVDQAAADDEADRLRAERDDAQRRLLMAQADLENFRKRVRRDYEDQIRYAAVPLLQDVLQVRDNLSRALEASAASKDAAAGGLREGVAMVAKLLEDTLAKHGCQPIPALGEAFDPNVHEAISQMPNDQYPAGRIAHVAVAGYRLHDRVIRPSQVVVSSGPAQA